jgi:hypothetical protein
MRKRKGSLIKDWKSLPSGREKYQCYLASREWALLKQAVKARSGGRCERCGAPGTQVHHQTYERLYAERLEDLLHVCGPCHLFLSGKQDRDPSQPVPFVAFGQVVDQVFISGNVPNGPDGPCTLPLPDGRCVFAMGTHNSYINYLVKSYHPDIFGNHVNNLRLFIGDSQLFFAWLEDSDYRFVLLELGYAAALNVPIVVASGPDFRWAHPSLFLCAEMVIQSPSPLCAWDAFLSTDACQGDPTS